MNLAVRSAFLLLVALGSVCCLAAGGDWPAWRGSERTAISEETGLLDAWPEGGPKLLWTASRLGEGYSTPSLAGELIYVMGNRDGQEWVLALDRTDEGEEVWATPVGAVRHGGGGYPGPRSTPTVDGERVYALGLNGDLLCLDRRSGKPIWRRDLVSDLGGQPGGWGYTESVLVDGPWVICTPGGSQATLAALDKANGDTVWEAAIGDPAGYASVVKAEIDGVKQYIQFTGRGVIGVEAAGGKLLWRYDAPANGTANISTPLVADGLVFAASGYGTGGGLANVDRMDQQFEASEVYFTKEMKNHHGGMVLLDGYLYGSDDPGVLTCLDYKTGERRWQERACGKCSLVYADEKFITRSEDGRVSLVRAIPGKFELLGQFEESQRSGQPTWPHPVIADGRLYLRDQDKLFCYDLRGE